MCSGYDGEIVPSSRTLERSKTVVGCTWSVSSNSPNILNWPLKSYLALLSIAKLQFPGTFKLGYILFKNISVSPTKPTWTLIQCLTLLHLADTPHGSTRISLDIDYRTEPVQMSKFSNSLSISRAKYVIFLEPCNMFVKMSLGALLPSLDRA
jgi:hypothetical protein